MHKFGYLERLNGLDRLPYWRHKPCNNISASEGSFFPPRDITKANRVHVYDKDLCRIIPLDYVKPVVKDGKLLFRAVNILFGNLNCFATSQ
jgi:scavenger receptor class B protein 1